MDERERADEKENADFEWSKTKRGLKYLGIALLLIVVAFAFLYVPRLTDAPVPVVSTAIAAPTPVCDATVYPVDLYQAAGARVPFYGYPEGDPVAVSLVCLNTNSESAVIRLVSGDSVGEVEHPLADFGYPNARYVEVTIGTLPVGEWVLEFYIGGVKVAATWFAVVKGDA